MILYFTIYICTILLLLLLFNFEQKLNENTIYALAISSPSFERQEIDDEDELTDWFFWPPKENEIIRNIETKEELLDIPFAIKESECRFDETTSPQIKSVSYLSDSKKLNVTIWMDKELLERNLVKDKIDRFNFKYNKTQPLWKNVKFTVLIDIVSTFNKGIDYRIEFSKDKINDTHIQWQEKLYEISLDGTYKEKVIKEYNEFPYNQDSFLDFSIDLNSISNPQNYKILSYVTDLYVKNGQYCRMVDSTNWILIPPPDFQIQVIPNLLEMRPADNNEVLVVIRGNAENGAEGVVNTNFIDQKYAILEFRSNTTYISSFSNGTSTLKVEIPNNLTKDLIGKSKRLFVPIYANISFPNTITNNEGDTFINNNSITINKSANLTLVILPPLELLDHIENAAKIMRPIGEIWEIVVVTIGSGIISFFIYLRKKKDESSGGTNTSGGGTNTSGGGTNTSGGDETTSSIKHTGVLIYRK